MSINTDGKITLKEVYERIIKLEGKMDGFSDRTSRTEKRFVAYLLVFGIILILNASISLVFFVRFYLQYGI
jgi:hypothetical protein